MSADPRMADWTGPVDERYFEEQARRQAEAQASDEIPWEDDPPPPDSADLAADADPPRPGAGLVGIAITEADLFHAPDGTAYADIRAGGHRETRPIRACAFKEWLTRRYFEENGKVPKVQQYSEARDVILGKARFEGPTHPVELRVAGDDQAIYLDLADEKWRVIRVTAEGWDVVADPPVRFRRTKSSAPLPLPVRGGSVEHLRDLMSVPGDDAWRLVVAWLLFTLSPRGPYPILLLHGEQGSAKSTTERVLRTLVDPSHSPLRTAPKEERDLMVACYNSRVVAFDNLSAISDQLSDALCRIAYGTGLAQRELYSDSEEVVLDACRPIAINGITELATRGDLLDRTILVDLAPISEDRRLTDKELNARLAALASGILGALLDAVAAAVRKLPTTNLERLPRMADFTLFVTAAEESLGWEQGSFLASYEANRKASNDISIDSSSVGPALRELIATQGKWEGTAADLRRELESFADSGLVTSRYWPKNAWSLAQHLERLAPNLRAVGIGIAKYKARRHGGATPERLLAIWQMSSFGPSPPSSRDAVDERDATPEPQTTPLDHDRDTLGPLDEEEAL
jgi:hypothetical protein